MIGLNGNDGLHYMVERVAKAIAGPGSEEHMMGRNKGRMRWELHIEQAYRVIKELELD